MNSEEPDFRRTNLMLKEQLDSQRKINLQSEEIVYLKAKLDQQYQLTINLSNQLETIQRENLQLKRDLQSSIKENTFTGRPPLTQINRESQDHHNNEQTLRPLKLQNLANYDIDLKNTAKYHGNNNSNHSVPARLPELQRPHSTQPVEIDNDASLLLMLKKPGHHSPGSYSPPKSLTLPSINELNKNVRDPIGTPRFHSHGFKRTHSMTFSDGGHSVYKKGYDSNGTIKDEQSSLFLRGSVNSSTTNGAESHMKAKGHSQPYHSANKSTHRRCMSCHSPNPAGYWIRNYQSPEGVICQICFAKKNLSSTDLVIDDSSQLLCSGCYDATRHGRPPFTDCPQCRASQLQRVFRSCSSCNEQSTFGSWYRDTANPGHFCCHKCYHNSNKIRLDTLPDGVVIHRTCSSCTAPKSSSWYRDLNITGAYICKQCYNQRYQSRTEIQPDGTAIPRACMSCASNHSATWFKDPDNNTNFMCKRCHTQMEKNKVASPIQDGQTRTCFGCDTTVSSRWYKDQHYFGKFNCLRCYNLRKKFKMV